jgi:hypothetical protein
MTLAQLLIFHAAIFYLIGGLLALGYISLNNKFEDRRDKIGGVYGKGYPSYYIKSVNAFKSLYFFFEVFALKKYKYGTRNV